MIRKENEKKWQEIQEMYKKIIEMIEELKDDVKEYYDINENK